MKLKKMTAREKEKIWNKMIKVIKDARDDDELYRRCQTAGFVLYEEIRNYIEDKLK